MTKKIALFIFLFLFIQQIVWGQKGIKFRINGAGAGCYVTNMLVDNQNDIIVTGYYNKSTNAGAGGVLDVNGRAYTLPGLSGSFAAKFSPDKEVLWLQLAQRNIRDVSASSHIILDANNNIYIVGRFQRNGQADAPSGETFVSKYSKDGIFTWERVLSGITDNGEFGPQIDSQGNLYLTGKYQGDLRLDSELIVSTRGGAAESYLLKLNADGRSVLSKSLAPAINLNAISINLTDEIFVVGDFQGTTQLETGFPMASTGLKDIFYAKYTSTGQLTWVRTIGGQADDECQQIKADKLGNIYLSGVVSNVAQFNTVPISTTEEEQNIFLTKLSAADGQLRWVRTMPFGGYSNYSDKHKLVAGLQVNSDGEPYIFGAISGFMKVNSSTQLVPDSFPIHYLIKHAANGDFSFSRQYNVADVSSVSYWSSMSFDSNGKVYLIGTTQRYTGTVRNDESFLIEKQEIDACNSQTFSIEKAGDILRPIEPTVSVAADTEKIFVDNGIRYQWYRNGERVVNATGKTYQTQIEGYYTLRLASKTNAACTKTSANFVGVYALASGEPLAVTIDYATTRLNTKHTMAGSTLEWYRNNQLINDQNVTSIVYQLQGTYQVKERFQNITKESNEVIFNGGIVVELIKQTYLQLGDPCRPGPYLRCNFASDVPVEYQWYLNGNLVRDSTRNQFNPITTGEYQVSVYMPDRNITYVSGKYKLFPSDFPKSLPIVKTEDACSGTALLKVDDAFMQKYQFQSIVWRVDGQDIPDVTTPYYKTAKAGYYTFSVNYLVGAESCTYNSFIEYNKMPDADLNMGYAYAGSGCVVDSFKIFVQYNKDYRYSWSRNDVLLSNEHSNELFVKDKGIYKAMINKGDGCMKETETVMLKGCTDEETNQFLMLNPPLLTADKTTVFLDEQSFIRANGCANVDFQWLKDTEPIAGANQANLEVKQTGTYRLKIEKFGCSAISEPVKIVVESILSSENDKDLQVRVFPNPFSESIHVELPEWLNKGQEIKLTNVSGKLIKSWQTENKLDLELAGIPEGVYLLIFDLNNKRVVKKIVKRQ